MDYNKISEKYGKEILREFEEEFKTANFSQTKSIFSELWKERGQIGEFYSAMQNELARKKNPSIDKRLRELGV